MSVPFNLVLLGLGYGVFWRFHCTCSVVCEYWFALFPLRVVCSLYRAWWGSWGEVYPIAWTSGKAWIWQESRPEIVDCARGLNSTTLVLASTGFSFVVQCALVIPPKLGVQLWGSIDANRIFTCLHPHVIVFTWSFLFFLHSRRFSSLGMCWGFRRLLCLCSPSCWRFVF